MTHARTTRTRRRHAGRAVAATAAAGLAAAGLITTATSASSEPSPAVEPAAADDVAHGDVILNLFQWTWTSVAEECATIGSTGIDAVQVSPPQEHIQGTEWWTSYQPVSYKIESKLGTREEFTTMVDTCGEAGVGVVADAVINHTTGADQGAGTGVAGTSFAVDDFPGVPYGPGDFNDCRENIANYGDRAEVQNCRLVSLQDLRTGSPDVQDKIAAYLNDLIDLGVQGFRIDAAKHVPAEDLAAIKAKLSDPDVYWVQEVIGAGGEPIQPSEYVGSGDVHEFDYARQLKNAFGGQLAGLRSIADGKLPSDQAGVFVTNHDTERNGETLTYRDGSYRLANVFMLAFPYGSPSLYSGYTFDDKDAGAPGATATEVPDADCDGGSWSCVQRDPAIAGMVRFHHAVEGTELTDWWDDGGDQIAFGRGDAGFVALNNGGGEAERTYATSLPAGEYTDVAAADGSAGTYTVAADGTFTATVPAHGAVALLPAGADG